MPKRVSKCGIRGTADLSADLPPLTDEIKLMVIGFAANPDKVQKRSRSGLDCCSISIPTTTLSLTQANSSEWDGPSLIGSPMCRTKVLK
jgi:hypothetical protein